MTKAREIITELLGFQEELCQLEKADLLNPAPPLVRDRIDELSQAASAAGLVEHLTHVDNRYAEATLLEVKVATKRLLDKLEAIESRQSPYRVERSELDREMDMFRQE